jgi:predicted enzyme related to lactoylglutathione lyase
LSKRVIHLEIHADDPAACARWYADLFGWNVQEIPALQYCVEALPKFASPGVGWAAYVIDPFGDIFGLHQQDAGAL